MVVAQHLYTNFYKMDEIYRDLILNLWGSASMSVCMSLCPPETDWLFRILRHVQQVQFSGPQTLMDYLVLTKNTKKYLRQRRKIPFL